MQQKFIIDLNLYNKSSIKEAIESFKEVAKIKLEGDSIIILGDNKSEIKEVFHEFMNYVIGILN